MASPSDAQKQFVSRYIMNTYHGHMLLLHTDGHHDLTDSNASHEPVGLSESSTHTSLQTICSGACQHLVDTHNVVRVNTDANVVCLLSCEPGQVLVAGNTGCFQALR